MVMRRSRSDCFLNQIQQSATHVATAIPPQFALADFRRSLGVAFKFALFCLVLPHWDGVAWRTVDSADDLVVYYSKLVRKHGSPGFVANSFF